MSTIDTVRRFRSLAEPISTVWHLDNLTAVGVLSLRDRKPELKLIVELDQVKLLQTKQLKHPWLDATKPPAMPRILAPISNFGVLTLDNCVQVNVRTSNNYGSRTSHCEIYLQPNRIWLGDPGPPETKPIQNISLLDFRLGGFFRFPGFDSYMVSAENHVELFKELGQPEEVWAFKPHRGEPITFGKTGFKFRQAVRCAHGMSHTKGYNYNTVSLLTLEPPPNTDRQTCEDIVHQFRDLLTVLSFEDFEFEAETYASEAHGNSTLLWAIGDRGKAFDPPMGHQILADLHEPQILQLACDRWFEASEVVRLSRWLFCKAVRETDDGLARFISIAQALEVLGRELAPSSKIVNRAMRLKAIAAIKSALEGAEIPSGYATRLVENAQNSNSTKYADALLEMMQPVEPVIVPVAKLSYPDEVTCLADFAKLVSSTRNALVHMTSDKRQDLEVAFVRVPKLSLLIGFCYAIIQANMLGLPLSKAHEFLLNNRHLRHGLPNDFLETS
jgi:ApeA N-terminal domain 1